MANILQSEGENVSAVAEVTAVISADSHVVEPTDLWVKEMPPSLRDQLPPLRERLEDQPGATNPADRVVAMAKDSISQEVLYPSHLARHFSINDPALQEASFKVYNDWLASYCAALPGRVVGVPAIPAYDIDHACAELQRCVAMGLQGVLLWHVPPSELSYSTDHYDRLWALASELDAPISLHIGTGYNPLGPQPAGTGTEFWRKIVVTKLIDVVNVLFDFIYYGVFDRFPRLKLVIVEFEIGWIPWLLQQWDYYLRRHGPNTPNPHPLPMELLTSDYFDRQIYATFMNDALGAEYLASGWGINNCMWSSDFPHGNSSWPHSRELIEKNLGHLDAAALARVLHDNVAELYHLDGF